MDNDLAIKQITDMVSSKPYWFHTIPLPYDLKTPGQSTEITQKWNSQAIPTDLKGLTVLDIGAWDGYYSFLCEQRGASVTAIDSLMHGWGTTGFDICKKILNSKVEFIQMDVMDVEKLETAFDVVLFLGVYYHLKHPLLAFDKLYKVTRQSLVLEGHFIDVDDKPLMFFYPNTELNGDPSNWWGANQQCLEAMLKVVGFKTVTVIDKMIYENVRIYNERFGRILIRADV